ncbi:MAG: hypothetical protein P8Z42_09940 [Anaerolineales bacterium]
MSSKKSKKRARKPNLPQEAYLAAKENEAASRGPESKQIGFNPDYSYVIKDLKRIAVLAGFFICLLVFLSFYLR